MVNINQIKQLQDLYGQSRVFNDVTSTSTGTTYLWNEKFIDVLDQFFIGTPLFNMSKADRENINKFIKFADGELQTDDKDYVVLEQLNIYLGSL